MELQLLLPKEGLIYSGLPVEFKSGADGRTRTGTAFATAPSRQRVYQFHHIGDRVLKSSGVPLSAFFRAGN